MFCNSSAITQRIVLSTGTATQLVFATAAIIFLASASEAATYPGYAFLTISGNNVAGNGAFSQFSGANGVITVSHSFSPGGAGTADNQNFAAGFHPGQFTNTFPGTGQVHGHLAQTVYNHTSTVEFNMTGYTITPNTVFGMWNTSDEVTAPVGGNPVYRVQLIDITNTQVNPTTFSYMGNQDNQTQVQGRHSLVMNTSTGEVTFGGTINGGVGTHTDAAFWRNIPLTTKKIIVLADLPPLNTIGDGVGYYFAELVIPEPSGLALCIFASFSLCVFGSRSRRCQR
jgi:hypothetical protein